MKRRQRQTKWRWCNQLFGHCEVGPKVGPGPLERSNVFCHISESLFRYSVLCDGECEEWWWGSGQAQFPQDSGLKGSKSGHPEILLPTSKRREGTADNCSFRKTSSCQSNKCCRSNILNLQGAHYLIDLLSTIYYLVDLLSTEEIASICGGNEGDDPVKSSPGMHRRRSRSVVVSVCG